MAQETVVDRRTVLAVAAAACSLTLAVGVTAAALFGYVGSGRTPGATAAPTLDPAASRVVLVPVQPAPAEAAVGADQREQDERDGLLLVSARRDEHREHGRRSERRHHEHDDDDD
jgi:hypothetical protein